MKVSAQLTGIERLQRLAKLGDALEAAACDAATEVLAEELARERGQPHASIHARDEQFVVGEPVSPAHARMLRLAPVLAAGRRRMRAAVRTAIARVLSRGA